MTTPTPPTEKCNNYYDSRTPEERANEPKGVLTVSHTTDKGWESRFKDLFLEIYRPAGMGDESDVDPRLLAFIQHIAKEEYKRGLGKGVYELKSLKGYIEQMEADGRVEIAWIKENIDGNIRNLEAALETPS